MPGTGRASALKPLLLMLFEQNALVALEICHRGYLFEIRSIAIAGENESLVTNERIKKVFLET